MQKTLLNFEFGKDYQGLSISTGYFITITAYGSGSGRTHRLASTLPAAATPTRQQLVMCQFVKCKATKTKPRAKPKKQRRLATHAAHT